MTTYALLNPNGAVDRKADNINPDVQTKAGWKWLPVERVNPDADPETQVKTGPVTTVEANRVVETYSVRDKTAQELDTDKASKVDRYDKIALQVAFNHENRIRALEGKQAITLAQFKTAIKALI